MAKTSVTIYTRYERFWHWTQAVLIFFLGFTGFNLHGTLDLLDFGTAVKWHTYSAFALLTLWLFTTFWNLTTGNWRQFLPFYAIRESERTGAKPQVIFLRRLWAVARYYAWDILHGGEHPHKKTLRRKQNALQGLAYLTFMVVMGPALWLTGVVNLTYDLWNGIPDAGTGLQVVAGLHTAAAFIIIAFALIHVYMTTTGKTLFHYVKTMITGVEDIELSEIEKAYLEAEHPDRLG